MEPLPVENVVVKVARGRGGRAGRGGRGGRVARKRPGPHIIEESAQSMASSGTPQVEVEGAPVVARPSSTAVPSPAISVKRGSSMPQRPRPRKILRCGENYGSEADSDDNEDELVIPSIPRTLQVMMETPMDVNSHDVTIDLIGEDAPAPLTTTDTDDDDFPSTPTYKPCTVNDFEWRAFPNPPIPPEKRRETFSQISVGPTTPYFDPYDIFVAIWDRKFMEYIASETNRFAQQMITQALNNRDLNPNARIDKWRDTTADELYVFFGLILAMGVVVKSKIEEYWNDTLDVLHTPGFSAHMSVDRFMLLDKYLHFNNNEDMCALELNSSEAKLFKIQPVLTHLNSKFHQMYTPAQNIVLDESLLLWKGSLDVNELISDKPATMGIKTYEIYESKTAYLWRFEVHARKKSLPQQLGGPMNPSTPATILRLLHGLENKGYTLWMDNFYNSPGLARRLKSIGFDCAGTLRTSCQFVPHTLHRLTNEKMYPGEVSGLTSGDIDVMVWRHQNRVSMISTYHGNAVVKVRITTKPILIADYNIMMGGVDKKDQLLALYPIERKRTKVWYKKFFKRLLNVSTLNSYIIHKQSSLASDYRNFRTNLIKSLLSKHTSSTAVSSAIKHTALPSSTTHTVPLRTENRYHLTHYLGEFPIVNQHHRRRRKCERCKKPVQTFCVGCNKTVCMSCFPTFHS